MLEDCIAAATRQYEGAEHAHWRRNNIRERHADETPLIDPPRAQTRTPIRPVRTEMGASDAPGCSSAHQPGADPGDFITTELGRQPVIMVRHRDGSVRVLLNRCTHRSRCRERCGHASV